jgi:predicted nucleotidyltransferase
VVTAIQDKLEGIADLCHKHGVVKLYVFGSATREDFQPGKSDLDLLVDFGTMGGHEKAHAYFALLDELEELLGVRVDLVMVNAVKNRYIARDIERTKQMLYAA